MGSTGRDVFAEGRQYLDFNATSPPLPEVVSALERAGREFWANPSSAHAPGRAASEALEKARMEVGAMLGREPSEVSFTSGATEANAWVFRGLSSPERPVRIVSAIEHPSVLCWGTHQVDVDTQGRVDLNQLLDLLKAHSGSVGLVSIMAANNETGVLQPVSEIARICKESGVLYHCDATQIPGRIQWELGAPDLLSLSAHKFGGPKGIGALVSRIELESPLQGGAQERGRRAGTVNVPGAIGMGVASRVAGPQSSGERDRLETVAIELGAQVVSGGAERLPNTSCLLFPVPGDLLVMALDLAGVSCSTGSACASGASTVSHVLGAMGLKGTPVRFSLGPDSEVSETIERLRTVYQQVSEACGL